MCIYLLKLICICIYLLKFENNVIYINIEIIIIYIHMYIKNCVSINVYLLCIFILGFGFIIALGTYRWYQLLFSFTNLPAIQLIYMITKVVNSIQKQIQLQPMNNAFIVVYMDDRIAGSNKEKKFLS